MYVTTEAPTADGTPTRTSTILSNHYFLDRCVMLVGSLLVGAISVVGLGVFVENNSFDRYKEARSGPSPHEPVPPRLSEDFLAAESRFTEGHPLEVYAENVIAYLTTPAIAYALLACGVLAVYLQWRFGR